jgi:hypothetical protein
MKKLISSVFLAFLAISLMAQTPITLKLNLEKGKVYKVKNTSKQVMQITAGGQQINMDITSNNVVSYKVLKQENGVMDIEFKFDTIASKTTSPMMNKEMNSAKPAGNDPLEKIMNKMSSNTIIAKISTTGKFVDFVTYPKFKDNVMMVLDSIPATKRDQAKMVADMLLKESAVKSMIEPMFAYLPEAAVKTGDSWETTYVRSASGMSMLTLNTFTLKSVDKNVGTISGKTEIESLPSTDPNAQTSQEIKGNMTFEGTIDVTTGLALNNTAKGRIEGTITQKANGQEMKMPIVIDSQSETIMIK